jgi:hypothetical protein
MLFNFEAGLLLFRELPSLFELPMKLFLPSLLLSLSATSISVPSSDLRSPITHRFVG